MLKKVIDNSIIIVYYIFVVRKEVIEMMSSKEISNAEDYLLMFNAEEMQGLLIWLFILKDIMKRR